LSRPPLGKRAKLRKESEGESESESFGYLSQRDKAVVFRSFGYPIGYEYGKVRSNVL